MSDLPGRPRRSRQETRQLWTERLARFSASTLSVAAFCAAEGVSPNSLFYWKRRLGTDPSGPAAPVISDGSPTFVPVRLHATAAVEVVLPGREDAKGHRLCPSFCMAILRIDKVACEQRLGGLLKHYRRAA